MTMLRGAAAMSRTDGARVLDDGELPRVRALLDADPVANALLIARLEAAGTLDPSRLGGRMMAIGQPAQAVCYLGGSVVPTGAAEADWAELADAVGSAPRSCSSIIGRADVVRRVWAPLHRHWGPARIVREDQPLLLLDHLARVAVHGDELVRPARADDLARYLPAAAAMYAEELGLTPFDGPHRSRHLHRAAEMIAAGRVLVRVDLHGRVVFKAELAAITSHTCQVQGVWLRPDLRGHGLGTSATAAVLGIAATRAPTVSLYVNQANVVARRMYCRLGMRQVGSLSTMLF